MHCYPRMLTAVAVAVARFFCVLYNKSLNIINILGLWPFQLNQKHKTNSGYKHNDKEHFTFDSSSIIEASSLIC